MKPVREGDVEVAYDADGCISSVYLRGRKLRRLSDRKRGCRYCFFNDTTFIKVDRGSGRTQNRQEVRRYKSLHPSTRRRWLPRLLGHAANFDWVAFERVKFTGKVDEADWRRVLRFTEPRGWDGDLGFYSTSTHNWGLRPDGRPVIFDLGY
jgi:hypothetical protein